MKKILFFSLCFTLVFSAWSFAETVAYWRFEAGPAGAQLPKTTGGYTFEPTIPDSSGNGNDLSVWDEAGAGYVFRDQVAYSTVPSTGETNNFSVKNSSGWPAMWAGNGSPITTITPAAFTIEATFKLENGGYRTIIGRDSRGTATVNGDLAALYFQAVPNNALAIKFCDVQGFWHEAVSAENIFTSFDYGSDNDGLNAPWYSMSAVSDGSTLSLYLMEHGGHEWQLIAQTDMTASGSTDTALTAGLGTGGDWAAGEWSVGRGLYAGGHGDRAWGYIDEVRISNSALDPSHFLLSPRTSAWEPDPHYAQKEVGTSTGEGLDVIVDLIWNTAMDPNNNQQVNPDVTAHYLYIFNDPSDPNNYKINPIEVPAGIPPASAASVQVILQMDQTYYWRVDESINGSLPTDPNTIIGAMWKFETIKSAPAFITQPASVLAEPGQQDVSIAVEVSSVSDVTYQWYTSQDKANNTPDDDQMVSNGNSPILSFSQVSVDDEGYYYCRAINDSGMPVDSDVAALGIKRELAHWTLDETRYLDGLYLDETTNYPADANGTPTFVTGQKAQGVDIYADNSWADAGNWNPSAYSGQLTVSFWLNWAGTNGTWQTFISKRSGDWNNENVLWQICTDNNSPTLWFQSPRSTVGINDALTGTEGQWQHLAMTFDGTTGVIYINGEHRSAGGFEFGDAIGAAICLGGNSFDSGPREFTNGSLDDIHIFNYAVSEMDIARIFTTDAPGRTACVQSLKPEAQFDLNDDCNVNLSDFAVFAANWMDCAIMPDCIQ